MSIKIIIIDPESKIIHPYFQIGELCEMGAPDIRLCKIGTLFCLFIGLLTRCKNNVEYIECNIMKNCD